MIKYSKSYRFLKHYKNEAPFNETYQKNVFCHWGQRKLLYSEIEFLTIVSKKINISECTLIYIGAAKGTHITILADLYPSLNFILCDGAPFDKILYDYKEQIIIKTGKDGFITDDKIPELLKLANRKYIIYVCDMRCEKSEDAIWNDMVNQQKWGIMLNSEFMLLKFRPPYDLDENKEKLFSFDLKNIENRIENYKEVKKGEIPYLAGKIYIQVFPKTYSTEGRLFVSKIKYENNKSKYNPNNYLIKEYNYRTYEHRFSYFNLYERNKKYKYKKSNDVKNNIIGYDDQYDCTSEYYIAYQFIKSQNTPKKDRNKNTIKLLNHINNFLMKYTIKTLLFCSFQQNLERGYYLDDISNPKKRNDFKNQVVNMLRNITQLKKKYYNDINIIKKTSILTKDEIDQQIKAYNYKFIKYQDTKILQIKDNNFFINFKKIIEITKKLIQQ